MEKWSHRVGFEHVREATNLVMQQRSLSSVGLNVPKRARGNLQEIFFRLCILPRISEVGTWH